MHRTSRSGFSLIELLVVISIIGLLAAIILASLNTARSRSRDAKRVADLKQIQLALEVYYNDNSCYPSVIYGTPSGTFCNGATGPALAPTYLPTIPTDPSDNSQYKYAGLVSSGGAAGGACIGFHLGATLEQANNTALNNDSDYVANTGTPPSGTTSDNPICLNSGADFSGVDPVYDIHS